MLPSRAASGTYGRQSTDSTEQGRASDSAILLQSQKDVELLLGRSRKLLVPLRLRQIIVVLDGPSAPDLNDTEIRLNAKLHECGCQEGSIAGASGLLIYVAMLFSQIGWPALRWKYVLLGIGFCFTTAMLGKAAGLLRARLGLIQELETLLTLGRIRKPLNTGE